MDHSSDLGHDKFVKISSRCLQRLAYSLVSTLLPCGSTLGSAFLGFRRLLNLRRGGIGDGVLGPPAGLIMKLRVESEGNNQTSLHTDPNAHLWVGILLYNQYNVPSYFKFF